MDLIRYLLNFSLFAILLGFLTKLLLPAPSIQRLLQTLLNSDAGISARTPAHADANAYPREGPLINADPSAGASRGISGPVDSNPVQKREESDSNYKEDDWEAIERTELESCFGAAVVYVGSSRNAGDLRRGVKKKLYGLHQIATQGPCCQPQPMPLRLSARAKWKAWEELGKMSPEEAMAAYVDLLSANIPGWRAHPLFTNSGP